MWSWILACVGIIGTFFVGRKTVWGWIILCVNECLWLIYATQTKQYGFYLGSIAYMVVYIKSYRRWVSEDKRVAIMANHPSNQNRFVYTNISDELVVVKTVNDINREQQESSYNELGRQ